MQNLNNRTLDKCNKQTIAVVGIGSVVAYPNLVEIQLEVVTKQMELTAARRENDLIMNNVIAGLRNLGVQENQMQTILYNMEPSYHFENGRQIFDGYEVTHRLLVRLTNFDLLDQLVDEAVKNGVTRIANIRFTTTEQNQYYQLALNRALGDGKQKAQTMSNYLQLRLKQSPIQITERKGMGQPQPRAFMAQDIAVASPIERGELMIQATVDMIFKYEDCD